MDSILFAPDSSAHILLVYAAVISMGLALGRVKLFGISLGVTCILFVGLAAGYLGWKVEPHVLGMLRDFGLVLFVFYIGLQVGPSFFASFRSGGLLLNGLMAATVLLSLAVTLALWALSGGLIDLPGFLGIHYGAVMNTPGLGATQEALSLLGYKGEDIAIGYACAYPLAVVGAILSLVVVRRVFRIDTAEEDRAWEAGEADKAEVPVSFHVEVANAFLNGKEISLIRKFVGHPFVCARIRPVGGEIISPMPETLVHMGDVLRIVSEAEHRDMIIAFFGKEATGVDLQTPHSPVHTEIVRLTEPSITGMRIRDLHLSHYDGLNVTRVYRAGVELFPYRNLHLQLGDGLRVVGPQRAISRFAKRVGNQQAKLDRPNIVASFIGIILGVVAGFIPIAIPGMPVPVKLGLAGGPLVVALLLGRFGATMKMATYTTTSANLMLRELGISLFLASVGLAAGEGFVNALLDGMGFLYMLFGVVITVVPLLTVGYVARRFFALNYFSIAGMLSGAVTCPAALAFLSTLSEKSSATIAYSTVYPLAMFLRIISGQIILVLFWSAL